MAFGISKGKFAEHGRASPGCTGYKRIKQPRCYCCYGADSCTSLIQNKPISSVQKFWGCSGGNRELLPGEGWCKSCVSTRSRSGQEESEVIQGEKELGWEDVGTDPAALQHGFTHSTRTEPPSSSAMSSCWPVWVMGITTVQ